MIKIKFKKTLPEVELPTMGSDFASGFDVKAYDIIKIFENDVEYSNRILQNSRNKFKNDDLNLKLVLFCGCG